MLEFIKKQNTEHLIIYVNPTASYSRVQSTTQRGRCCHACPSPTTALPHCPTTCNNFGSTTALTMNKFVIMKNRHFLVYTTPKRLVLFCSSFLIFSNISVSFFCSYTIGEPSCNWWRNFLPYKKYEWIDNNFAWPHGGIYTWQSSLWPGPIQQDQHWRQAWSLNWTTVISPLWLNACLPEKGNMGINVVMLAR